MSAVAATVAIPDWLVARLGNPDPVALGRRVLEALVADCLRTGLATGAEARDWLGLDAPGTMDAFRKACGIAGDDTEAGDGA